MTRDNCPVCDDSRLQPFFRLDSVPVLCNALFETEEEATDADRAAIELGICSKCGHIYNREFDPSLIHYSGDYENSLHYSAVFSKYAEHLAERLITEYVCPKGNILEIGCGKGEFLRILEKYNVGNVIGIDPSYQDDVNDELPDTIQICVEPFSGITIEDCSLIICRHVLEHMAEPMEFLSDVSKVADQNKSTNIYFEVPNGLWILNGLGVWDIIYEHCSYFLPSSLKTAFNKAGYSIRKCYTDYSDQFLCIESSKDDTITEEPEEEINSNDILEATSVFSEHFSNKVSYWGKKLSDLHKNGKTVAVWGAGSKGVTFLNTVPEARYIREVVDINSRKQGLYVPGTGQCIITPEQCNADIILVMNPAYINEIKEILTHSNKRAEVLAL